MPEQFDDLGSQHYLIGSCFDFGGCEISVIVGHNGISYWTDESAARKLVRETGKSGIDILLGDKMSAAQIHHLHDEHTIQVPVPENDLTTIRNELAPRYWADCEKDFELSERLDAILLPLFWQQVNPLLSPPCNPN